MKQWRTREEYLVQLTPERRKEIEDKFAAAEERRKQTPAICGVCDKPLGISEWQILNGEGKGLHPLCCEYSKCLGVLLNHAETEKTLLPRGKKYDPQGDEEARKRMREIYPIIMG